MTYMNEPCSAAATKLVWVHVFVFAAIAGACYLAPEIPFGDSAWLPLARFAAFLLAAALSGLVTMLIGAALSGSKRAVAPALLVALVFDAQVPIIAFSQPASLEYLHTGLGIAWFVVPVVFLTLTGVTVYFLLRHTRRVAAIYAGVSG
jgi:hypothetical protein